ncbi:MAG: CCA tRNA nucleotidyltransferase [Deltaproteobacteria bacterium]|jgi:tRNA nucleotidyltransferase/poly(A) polymerase|nr:CCA tRNA nucleotidyltransferase [Deltaproteobacteria bacterium]MBT4266975.1 CCA tRNA nucleotidyltransferase [Deltaproteobacteria bacterium]MBT4639696.1 CCA tRNA nucleotidyltransferase [Deltaproteobacteria bacterium]MBT6504161.1 CCA tRNA nucleotidyltransferase [Deltaproteobacteria bacterium]MBT6614518.1 CCA tRNA nucleotidyltransferase [Deltaproteobacteria bacterium]
MSILQERFSTLPQKVRDTIWKFTEIYKREGFECFLVGGSCRDLLLGEMPYDFDYATNCPLHVSRKLFKKVISIGASHGTLIISFYGFHFEITRFRKDVSTDGRKAVIAFSDSIEEDQKRRDLRLNALAYDVVEDRLVDSQNALDDFKEKKIRFVGNAEDRIKEDHLRALRYGRLISKLLPLGFSYDPDEMQAVIRIFDSRFLSIERIYDEFGKILAPGLKDNQFLNDYLPKLNIFKQFFPDPETAGKVMERIVETGSHLPLAFQYHKTHTIAETSTVLKLSRENKRLILLLKEFSEQDLSDNTILKSLLSKAEFIDINALLIAINDLIGVDVTRHVLDIIKKGQPYRVKDLALQGNDLQELGIKGRGIGLMINLLLNAVWAQPQLNSKEQLLRLAADLKEKMRDSNPDAGD